MVAGLANAQTSHTDSPAYRIIGKTRYQILDSSGFYLYHINKLVQGEKIARPQDVYYFSIDAASPVKELTMDNLEKEFASNTKFRYALVSSFRNDRQLIGYDKTLGTYKIEYIYGQSLK